MKIEIKQRRFILELEEHEASSVALILGKDSVVTSPAYKVKEKLIEVLGYTPEEDIY